MKLQRRERRALALTGYVAVAGLDAYLAGSSHRAAHRARWITKPLLMPLLATSLSNSPHAATSPLVPSTLAAQASGWIGDIALLNEGTNAFAAGAGAFGVGHAAYITGFTNNRRRSRRLRETPVAKGAAALALTAGPVMAVGAAREEKVLAPAVIGYVGLLSTMFASAGNLRPSLPPRARWLTLAGAASFLASDTLLATKQFWWKTAPARAESVVMVTYTLGQLLISEGAASAV